MVLTKQVEVLKMNIKELKTLQKKHKITSWVEAGINVLKVGDKLFDKTSDFNRLKYYGDSLVFCSEEEQECGHCGGIFFDNGLEVYYNVICKQQDTQSV